MEEDPTPQNNENEVVFDNTIDKKNCKVIPQKPKSQP